MAALGRLAIPAVTDEQNLKMQEVLQQIAKVQRKRENSGSEASYSTVQQSTML